MKSVKRATAYMAATATRTFVRGRSPFSPFPLTRPTSDSSAFDPVGVGERRSALLRLSLKAKATEAPTRMNRVTTTRTRDSDSVVANRLSVRL